MQYLVNKMGEFRAGQLKKLESNNDLTIGDVTTVNLTIIEGGVQANVVPPTMKIIYDCRIAIDVPHADFEAMVSDWLTGN